MAPRTGQVGGREGVDTNAVNRPAAAPDATGSPDADLRAAASTQSGGYVSNGQHLPAVESVEEEYFGGVPAVGYTQTSGSISTNRIGPGVGKGGI